MATQNVSPIHTRSNTRTQRTETLRKEVLHLMIDLDLPLKNSIELLARELSAFTGRQISRNSLTMALAGYRTSAAYFEYLSSLKQYLQESAAANSHLCDSTPKNKIINENMEGNHVE